MPKLKILFEAGPMIDSHKSGVGHYIASFVTSLDKFHGGDLEITGYFFNFLNRKSKPRPKLGAVQYKVIRIVPGKLLAAARRFGLQPFLECFTSSRHADIVLYTNYVSLPLLRKRKQVLMVYDLSFWDHPEFTQAVNLRFLRRFFRASVYRADLIITVSAFTKQRLLHYFPDLRAEVLVTPIPPDDPPSRKIKLSSRLTGAGVEAGRYILHVGTIEPRKNLQNLVQAYSLIDDKLRSRQALVLAGGKGWKNDDIFAAIRDLKSRGCNIILTGYVSDDERAALYAHASCVVMPSHYEGFGMPILEAMQQGVPVAVSDIPVFHEVAGAAALYFDKDQPADIASTLSKLLTDGPARQKLAAEAPGQLASFSWHDNADRVYAAFRTLND